MTAQYLTSAYLSLLAMLGQDIYLRTTMGNATGVFTSVLGLFVNGNLLGTFAEIVYEINYLDLLSQTQADATVGAMSQVDLDQDTKNVAINYVKTISMEIYH